MRYWWAVYVTKTKQLTHCSRDTQRKTAINAMYYNLEEVYFPAQKSYPRVLSANNLKAMDAKLLKDPQGVVIGEHGSDYRYEPTV